MINKSSLQSIISKYYLGGINESTKWEIKNGTLTIKFMSPSQDMLGKITYTNFPLEDVTLVIFNTSQLNKLISVTSGGLILSVVKTNKIATRLEVADSQFNVTYALADSMMVNKVADVEEPSSYGVEINLDQENIMALIKSKNALGEDDTLIIENSIDPNGNNIVLFTLGENTSFSNKITYSIPVKNTISFKLPFSSNMFKEILAAHKDMDSGIISINEEGLMKIKFSDQQNLTSEYYLIRKADL